MMRVVLMRNGGLGDVLMALSAAHAVKACGHHVTFITSESLVPLIKYCPHVDRVYATTDLAYYDDIRNCDYFFDLGSAINSVIGKHLVDAFLEKIGITASPFHKELCLDWPPDAYEEVNSFLEKKSQPQETSGKKRVLLHPGVSDPNRNWAKSCWESLAKKLVVSGYEVIIIGKSHTWGGRGAHVLEIEGVINAIDFLSLGATGVLMDRSDLLVACDSGPIQLAGATSIAILGIYTVVKADDRLPFRKGQLGWNCYKLESNHCPWWPCYRHMLNPTIWKPYAESIENGSTTIGEVFSQWCLNNRQFSCVRELDPETVASYCLKILGSPQATSAVDLSFVGNG